MRRKKNRECVINLGDEYESDYYIDTLRISKDPPFDPPPIPSPWFDAMLHLPFEDDLFFAGARITSVSEKNI